MFLQFAFIGLCLLQEPDSTAFGRHFLSIIDRERLQKTPKWITSDEPRISASRAVALGNACVSKMEPKEKEWQTKFERNIDRISLMPVDDDWWYWQIDYVWFPRNIHFTGMPMNLKIIVLMDGSVVQPKEVKFFDRPPGAAN